MQCPSCKFPPVGEFNLAPFSTDVTVIVDAFGLVVNPTKDGRGRLIDKNHPLYDINKFKFIHCPKCGYDLSLHRVCHQCKKSNVDFRSKEDVLCSACLESLDY